jgi:signal transduction histidine kinase
MDAVVVLVQKFFLYFGIANAAVFVLFAFFFSRSMSRPLRELNAIAAEMGKLNFSLQYNGNRRDEIGQLGGTLNALMKRLENTISQLKGELSKEKTLEKMRTQFTAQVSHELQTPLSVIKGYAEALADNLYAGEEAEDAYRILVNEAEKLSSMVDDLLNLSQIEAGAYVLNKQKFSLQAMFNKLDGRYRVFADEKRIHLHINVPDDASCFGDEQRLEQAVNNILTNAMKHTPDDGNIFITLTQNEENIVITVENDGDPISKEDLPHIFESYYRGKSSARGTGLGLAITKHIITLHGGSITAANTKRGVLFEIILPLQ